VVRAGGRGPTLGHSVRPERAGRGPVVPDRTALHV